MRNQFFYTRTEVTPPEGEDPPVINKFQDSFNLDLVLRSMEIPGKKFVVMLDDLHERTEEIPITNKHNKVQGTKKNLVTYQSEIILDPEDAIRFKNLTSLKAE